MPRYYDFDASNLTNYDNDPEFQNFDFFKHCFPEEDFPEYHNKEDIVIEDLTKQMCKMDLKSMKVSQLKRMCKDNGIKGYSKKKKAELIGLLTDLKL